MVKLTQNGTLNVALDQRRENMKTRILAMIMALIMVLLCFAGCTGTEETPDASSSQGLSTKAESEKENDESKDEEPDKEEVKSRFVYFLVDVSASMAPLKKNTIAAMRETLANLKSTEENVKIAILAYANDIEYKTDGFLDDCEGAIDLFEKKGFLNYPATNEALGLNAAADDFRDVAADKKQVVVFTDGRETLGDRAEGAETLSQMGVELTTVNVSHESELQLVSVSTSLRVPYKENVKISVIVRSTMNRNAKIVIREDGASVNEVSVTLTEGDNLIPITYAPTRIGINFASVTVEAKDEGLDENNTLWSWYLYEDKYSMLIVDGDSGKETDQITQLQNSGVITLLEDYKVSTVSLEKLPKTLEGLLEYDQIVLMDVDFNAIPDKANENLKRYVEECGRSLFVSFGENFYDIEKEKFENSPLSEILPVTLKSEGDVETAAVVLVVDLSSSMKDILAGTKKSRFEVLVEGVKDAIMLSETDGGLSDEDYIGVICFDQSCYVALEMQQIGDLENRGKICKAVEWELRHYYNWYYLNPDGTESDYPVTKDDGDTYTKLGYSYPSSDSEIPRGGYDKETNRAIKSYGTSYKWAIQEASNMLEEQSGQVMLHIKQVLFMSDGAPNDKGSGYVGIVERMANSGIETSAIALCGSRDETQIRELMKIAETGNGNFFVTETGDELKTALAAGMKDAANSKELINERSVLPHISSYSSEALRGVRELDVIGGYYPSTIKWEANLVFYVDNMRPLYAEWEFGLGKVSVFMSDLGNEAWTKALLDSPNGGLRFVYNVLTVNMNRRQDSSGIQYAIERDSESGFKIEVVVPTELRRGEKLMVKLCDQNGEILSVDTLTEAALKRYVADFVTNYNAAYALELFIVDEKSGEIRDLAQLGITIGYSFEYDVLPEPEDDGALDEDGDGEQGGEQEGEGGIYDDKFMERLMFIPSVGYISVENLLNDAIFDKEYDKMFNRELTYKQRMMIVNYFDAVKGGNGDSYEIEQENVKIAFISEKVITENGRKNADDSFLYMALTSVGYKIRTADMFGSASEATGISGYDLYIYDGITPAFLPTDGAVWLLDSSEDFEWKTGVEISDDVERDQCNGFGIEVSDSAAAQEIAKNVHLDIPLEFDDGVEVNPAVAAFRSIGSLGDSFAPVLMANDNVIVATGEYNGNVIVISTFDFADSSLIAYITDFPLLINNMLEYSVK